MKAEFHKVVIVLDVTDGKYNRVDSALSSLLNPRQVSAGKCGYHVRAVGSADAKQARQIMEILNNSKYVVMPS